MKVANRNSSFELIKVFAIICIVFCHSIPTERIEYHVATTDSWLFGVMLFRQLGSIGNAIFMVASTWFLVDSDKVNFGKVKRIVADNQIISIIFLLAGCAGGYCISFKMAIKQAFPFLFATLWYVTCYVMYYVLHGFINKALRESELNWKKTIFVLILFDAIVFVTGSFYFNELMGFIIAHVLTWYLKKGIDSLDLVKVKRYGLALLVTGLVGWLVGALILNIVGVNIEYVGQRFHYYNRFYNPFILAIAYGLVILAETVRFQSNLVNRLSGCSLYIYMITGNQVLRVYTDNIIYDLICNKFGVSMLVCFEFVIVYSIIKFILGTGLAIVYTITIARVIKRITMKGCEYIEGK